MKDGLYTRHEVACIIADLFGDTCACDYSCNDEWLPQYCDFADNVCPNFSGYDRCHCKGKYKRKELTRELCYECKKEWLLTELITSIQIVRTMPTHNSEVDE